MTDEKKFDKDLDNLLSSLIDFIEMKHEFEMKKIQFIGIWSPEFNESKKKVNDDR